MLTILLVPALWLLKSVLYGIIFRIRSVKVTVLSCLIIGGSRLLLTMIPFIGFLSFPLTVGVAVYLTMQFTEASLIPDGLFIPLGIETVFVVGMWLFTVL
ncbi:MAG TPA: hypothetical protein VK141_11135 [Nitrosomonas sp.]|nr:hypothetical protein [Nitrosomonas sp.]